MKPKYTIPSVLSAFALGFGVAWLVKPVAPDKNPEALAGETRKSDRKSRSTTGNTGGNGNVNALLMDMRQHVSSPRKLGDDLALVGMEQIPDLLSALADKAGVNGLDSEDNRLFDLILRHWYKVNPDAAVGWVMGLDNENDQRSMLSDLLKVEAANDFDAALALLEKVGSHFEKGLTIPTTMLEKAATRDVATFLRVCIAGVGYGDHTGGMYLDYGKGFDFAAAMKGLADAQAALSDGQRFSTLPGNLLEEWAKHEPQAALDWVQQDKDVMFNSGIKPFLDGYKQVATSEELGDFVAHLFEVDGGYGKAWDALSQLENESVIRNFLSSASEKGSPEQHLEGLFRSSVFNLGDANDPTRTLLLSMMGADARYRMLTSENGVTIRSRLTREALQPVLERLGHSEEQIEQMLREPTKRK